MSDYKFFMECGTKSHQIYILEWAVKISDDAELIISKYQNTTGNEGPIEMQECFATLLFTNSTKT